MSLPSRGAWIEIGSNYPPPRTQKVAPLAGSVDRNILYHDGRQRPDLSLPSRGAWIEMEQYTDYYTIYLVAPLAGSVDRNNML